MWIETTFSLHGPPAIAALAVKARRMQSVRPRRAATRALRAPMAFGLQVALLTKSGRRAAFAQQSDLIAACRADRAQSPQGERDAFVRAKRRSGAAAAECFAFALA